MPCPGPFEELGVEHLGAHHRDHGLENSHRMHSLSFPAFYEPSLHPFNAEEGAPNAKIVFRSIS